MRHWLSVAALAAALPASALEIPLHARELAAAASRLGASLPVEGRLECARVRERTRPWEVHDFCWLVIGPDMQAVDSPERLIQDVAVHAPPRAPFHVFEGAVTIAAGPSATLALELPKSLAAAGEDGVWDTKHAISLTVLVIEQRRHTALEKAEKKYGAGSRNYDSYVRRFDGILKDAEALRQEVSAMTMRQVEADPSYKMRLDFIGAGFTGLLDEVGWTDADEGPGEGEEG